MRSDAEVVDALRAGDAETFRDVVTDLTPGLTRLARTYVPQALADEIVQETWAAVVSSIDRFEQRSSLKTWIYRILLNKVRTLAKRESKIVPFASMGNSRDSDAEIVDAERFAHPDRPGHWLGPPTSWDLLPAERVESDETLEMIRAAIVRLPESQREVVELRDVQGWTADEVCNTLGISSVNQRVLLHRGRSAVRAMLEEYLRDD